MGRVKGLGAPDSGHFGEKMKFVRDGKGRGLPSLGKSKKKKGGHAKRGASFAAKINVSKS